MTSRPKAAALLGQHCRARRPVAALSMEDVAKEGGVLNDLGVQQRKAVRVNEPSSKRRARRLRADCRTYNRIIRAAQAAGSHHSKESVLVQFVREFMLL